MILALDMIALEGLGHNLSTKVGGTFVYKGLIPMFI